MITETISVEKCTGCKMCADICPFGAILFSDDSEGFWYPSINKSRCKHCGLCDQTCPVSTPYENVYSQVEYYAAWSKSLSVRLKSTSGGIFSEVAQYWIRQGGICYGAAYDKDMTVHHISISSKDKLEKLRMSKYAQSDMKNIYKSVKKDLVKHYQVLFSGTPCQVAALKRFLKIEYENLFTVDFVCNGVPSPKVFRTYLNELEKKYNSTVRKVIFKHKKRGWHNLGTLVEFQNGHTYFRTAKLDAYMKSYIHADVNVRKSCYRCAFRKLPHESDLMLGDFWGVEHFYPKSDDNKGISLVVINSDKGNRMWKCLESNINSFKVSEKELTQYNKAVYEKRKMPAKRSHFYENIGKYSFLQIVLEACGESSIQYWWNKQMDFFRYLCEKTGFIQIVRLLRRR